MENQNLAKKVKVALICSIIALAVSILACIVPSIAADSVADTASEMYDSYR